MGGWIGVTAGLVGEAASWTLVPLPTRRKRASVALPIVRPTRLPWGEVTGGHTIASPTLGLQSNQVEIAVGPGKDAQGVSDRWIAG